MCVEYKFRVGQRTRGMNWYSEVFKGGMEGMGLERWGEDGERRRVGMGRRLI